MKNEIFISLKLEFAELIEQQQKNHEFRKYAPKNYINKFWIYVTCPVAQLKYIAQVGDCVEYPNKISNNGIGNYEFNFGLKKSKYAFAILHLYSIKEPIELKSLKNDFKFFPPQSYAYADKYATLVEYVNNNCILEKVF